MVLQEFLHPHPELVFDPEASVRYSGLKPECECRTGLVIRLGTGATAVSEEATGCLCPTIIAALSRCSEVGGMLLEAPLSRSGGMGDWTVTRGGL